MHTVRVLFVISLLLLVGGCMISEQIGEPVGQGRNRMPSKDVTMHFDTQFNRILVFGRSALLAVLALWIFSAWRKSPVGMLIGAGTLVFAGWLIVKDYPSLTGYRIEVVESGLHLNIPPDLEEKIPWGSVQSLELAGHEWASVGGGSYMGPLGREHRTVGVELPDWETMTITLTGGQTYTLDLKLLSVEHRQIFSQALVKRAGLVKEE